MTLQVAGQPETRTLIVPIFFQVPPLYTTFDITEVNGKQVDVCVEEVKPNGHVNVGTSLPGGIEENDWWDVSASAFLAEKYPENGWARITYPADRNVRAVATMASKDDPEISTKFVAVPPVPSFRLMAWRMDRNSDRYYPRGETAIVIVNPTEEEQRVDIVFYGRDFRSGQGHTDFRTRTWRYIGPYQSLSRFLTELVSSVMNYSRDGFIKGILEITGETVIAVGALDFFRNTGQIRGIPVEVAPKPVTLPRRLGK